MVMLQTLNSLMNYQCPRCPVPRGATAPQAVHSPEAMIGSGDLTRTCNPKELKQIARGPFKYRKLVSNNMAPEVLLGVSLDLFSGTRCTVTRGCLRGAGGCAFFCDCSLGKARDRRRFTANLQQSTGLRDNNCQFIIEYPETHSPPPPPLVP